MTAVPGVPSRRFVALLQAASVVALLLAIPVVAMPALSGCADGGGGASGDGSPGSSRDAGGGSTTAVAGRATVEIQGPAGPLGVRVFYPAVVIDGEAAADEGGPAAAVDTEGGPYPLIAFGHGYLARVSFYAPTLDALAAEGFIVVAPTSQTGLLPDHSDFADELRAALDWAVAEGDEPGSLLYGAVDGERLGVSGHSMGGGCALLAAARDTRIRAVSTLAAADTRPSSRDLLRRIGAPVQFIAGSEDAIAMVQAFQVPLFEAVPAPRQLVVIEGGSHCGFLDRPPALCDRGRLPAAEQIAVTRSLLSDWFGLYLRGDEALRVRVWDPDPDPLLEIVSDP
jgi:pimeloyl-ACP methyl ester carboxylesterase